MPQAFLVETQRNRGADPAGRYIFEVVGRGISASFQRVRGLREQIEIIKLRSGVRPLEVRNVVGTIGGGVVTFEKGVIRDAGLSEWFDLVLISGRATLEADPFSQQLDILDGRFPGLEEGTVLNSGPPRPVRETIPLNDAKQRGVYRDLEVVLADCRPAGGMLGVYHSIRHWKLLDCVPTAYEVVGGLDATSSEIAIESLSLAFTSITTDSGVGAFEGPGSRTTAPPRQDGRGSVVG